MVLPCSRKKNYYSKLIQNTFLKICELLLKNQTISMTSVFHPPLSCIQPNTEQTQSQVHPEDVCKFCYLNEQESQEKLISPCGCTGSLQYVHKECLEKWLQVEADRKQVPLADINFKLKRHNLKCKLCSKEIIFQKQSHFLSHLFTLFQWITIFCFIKKLKYYACISILGSLAINYYFLRYFFGKMYNISLKIKDHSVVSFVLLSLVLVLLEQTFIEVKWNQNSMEFTIPYLANK